MGAQTAEAAALKAEVERAVLMELARTGADRFRPDTIVKAFKGRAGRTTLFRWIRQTIESGKPAQAITKAIKRRAAARAKRTKDPSADAAREAVELLPVMASPSDMMGGSAIPVIERLRECLKVAEDCMRHARTPEGAIRNSGLLLKASEHLRRSLETACRLSEAMHSIDRLDRFHDLILQEIAKLAPETAEVLTIRLGQLSSEWGG
jgi:hypothetical protein